MIVEALKNGDVGCGVEEYRHGMIRGGAQAWYRTTHNDKLLTWSV